MRYVAPRFQGQAETLVQSRDWIEDRMGLVFGGSGAAQVKAFTDVGKEAPEAMLKASEALRRSRDGAKDSAAHSMRTTNTRISVLNSHHAHDPFHR